ncbi:Hypothetical predicted protein [Octopus vulgaris]|uniref:Uncharacterized protein n=1 Tax=Octopus vulgaris TaxID=6645 RepID=A0AA36BK84_OCTVU|nr:Hypothetical predicted protein [Octopus vulgaris]
MDMNSSKSPTIKRFTPYDIIRCNKQQSLTEGGYNQIVHMNKCLSSYCYNKNDSTASTGIPLQLPESTEVMKKS